MRRWSQMFVIALGQRLLVPLQTKFQIRCRHQLPARRQSRPFLPLQTDRQAAGLVW